MRMRLGVALVAAMVLTGCGGSGSSPANPAPPLCKLTDSPNTCLRCWAQKCAMQLDYCFGVGFHSGELVSAAAINSTAGCFDFSKCVQTCGCFDSCFETCSKDVKATCTECQQKYFAPCRETSCAAECRPIDGGA